MHETQDVGAPREEARAPLRAPGRSGAADEHPLLRFARNRLRRELDALAAYAPPAGEAPDPEAVHRLRIAARRLRVWLGAFDALLPPPLADDAKAALRAFARELGALRDLDVHVELLPGYVAATAGVAADDLGRYALELQRARAEARAAAANVFVGSRFEKLRATLAALEAAVESDEGEAPLASLAELASRRLRKRIKRFRRLGREIVENATAESLHRLRIEAKRLRYELELFAPAYPSLAPYAKSLKSMQDLLGEHQDAVAASGNLERYALGVLEGSTGRAAEIGTETLDKRHAFALGRLSQAQLDHADDVRRRFPAAWRTLDKALKRARKEIAELA